MSLRDELLTDPGGLGYDLQNLAAVEVLINTKDRTKLVTRIITSRGASAIYPKLTYPTRSMSFEASMLKLETFANSQKDSANTNTKLIARAVYRQLDSFNRTGLDMGDSEVHTMLDFLASLSVITVAEAKGFKDMGVVSCSRAEQLGYAYVDDQMIREALV